METESAIGRRLKAIRQRHGLTLDNLAASSGVSRAMISRIERGEASPTAALLGRLCAALGLGLSAFFADEAAAETPLLRAVEQPVWRDPASGYLRRNVSPRLKGSPLEVVEVEFPPGETVHFDSPWSGRPIHQVVWVLDGILDFTLGETTYRLATGDSLALRLDRPTTFFNPGETPVRYAVCLAVGTPS